MNEGRLQERPFFSLPSAAGKPGPASMGQTIEAFVEHRTEEIVQLAHELRNKSYHPKPVKRVDIPKGGDRKGATVREFKDKGKKITRCNSASPICSPHSYSIMYILLLKKRIGS
ncbi:MAG: hypothetical protein PF441_06445 [Desulfuromusa sp.]|nr:hypothetical protein [Desulfuromusa sp.]